MAIFLARGGKSLTTCPPMRISPAVGSSSPAIIRRSVVFPQPDGPSRTRNSPSLVARDTPFPAAPWPKNFFPSRVSTVAIRDPLCGPAPARPLRAAVPSKQEGDPADRGLPPAWGEREGARPLTGPPRPLHEPL